MPAWFAGIAAFSTFSQVMPALIAITKPAAHPVL